MGRNPEKLECDLVMRGGITSGIVYPRAIANLAETYNFRSIGGTSAGAIAAAATAAAQFGANNGDDRFQTIYELPKKLAKLKDGKSTLQRLFQPQPGTSRLFSLLMSGLDREGKLKKILRIVTTGLANYWCYSVAGAALTLDAPLPGRPTFGINLVPDTVETTEIDETDDRLDRVSGLGTKGASSGQSEDEGWDKVWMPSKNNTGISSAARFNKFQGLVGFFGALFDTARNWGDTELMAMPGYRDRVVHVELAEDEGGLNLSMPPKIIEALGERGERAGELLAGRFAPTPTGNQVLIDPKTGEPVVLTWDNHRWVRYRSFMAAVELVARRFRATWKDVTTQKNWRPYDDLLNRAQGGAPVSYPFHRPGQQDFAVAETARLVDWTTGWTTDEQTFDRNSNPGRSPRPKPGLRMMPPGANDPRADRGV